MQASDLSDVQLFFAGTIGVGNLLKNLLSVFRTASPKDQAAILERLGWFMEAFQPVRDSIAERGDTPDPLSVEFFPAFFDTLRQALENHQQPSVTN